MANQTTIKGTKVSAGDTVKVHQLIKEGDKERTQIFQGVVIAIKGTQENKTFTVRRIASGGIGVERIWPVVSPWITQVEVVKKGNVRRAKLFYLRKRVGRRATKVKEKLEEKTDKTKPEKSKASKKSTKSAKKPSVPDEPKKKKSGKTGRTASQKTAKK